MDLAGRSDQSLLTATVDSDDCFTAFYDRHAVAIFRFAARRVGADVADQVLIDTFAVAFQQRGTYDAHHDTALPWLYGIASHVISRHRRAEVRHLRAAQDTRTYTMGEDAIVDRLDAETRWSRISKDVARLPAKQRDVLFLFALADLSYEQIAATLDIPVGTVRSRLNKARKRLGKEHQL